jgi:hypothetical protein
MDTKDNEFFFDHMKTWKTMEGMFGKVHDELRTMRGRLVQFENDLVSADVQLKKKQEELADVAREIKDQKMLGQQSTAKIREELNRRHVELVERESKIKLLERAAQEQLDKANNLLAAAEVKASTRRKPVEA